MTPEEYDQAVEEYGRALFCGEKHRGARGEDACYLPGDPPHSLHEGEFYVWSEPLKLASGVSHTAEEEV